MKLLGYALSFPQCFCWFLGHRWCPYDQGTPHECRWCVRCWREECYVESEGTWVVLD